MGVYPPRSKIPGEFCFFVVDVIVILVVIRCHSSESMGGCRVLENRLRLFVEMISTQLQLVSNRIKRPVVHPPVVDDAIGVCFDPPRGSAHVLVEAVREKTLRDHFHGLLEGLWTIADGDEWDEAGFSMLGEA